MNTSTIITSVYNEKVKNWVQLKDRKYRQRTGLFLVEGIHLVQVALQKHMNIEVIAYSMERGIPEELTPYRLENEQYDPKLHGTPTWIAVTDTIIRKCTDVETPPPVFAVIKKTASVTPKQLLMITHSLVVVIDSVQDPGNLGTIIRVAEAVGAGGVILGKGTVDLYHAKTIRATMGALFQLPIIEANLEELLPVAKQNGIRLVGTSLQAVTSCYEQNYCPATWFVVGNEGQGISPTVAAYLDHMVIIPMRGATESLNVAMATTILLYEATRQRYYR